ncbi:MAG: 16S rRNA (adenine(1518)-N(6)/adenine(1519)-N(6))-dimethyltransferase RsmA [Bacteroidota bacterium]|nr:16S rRNA (adenine(1518)-N(6)/adenine(1519)-N(6))-dimethyltransferase RsmA [Bacteroidota bacterium]MDP4211327.1 16S rRNA (adenine(1518)-N(6)/adenine(1519)-N(6))-dimethyltransferase RsmA [Bacteroidota bacterium]MDP4250295.1 16S rRNA (adenine(1518)-N(6)/adenine(1519)-N(6))-dimethyltransferase RsmA [Bacteroidota bacterium]
MIHLPSSLNLKKSLGQHFLKDEAICRQIVDALLVNPFTQLLEIGPGAGALTKYLIEIKDIDFKAVEIDAQKAAYLRSTYPALIPELIEADFLRMNSPFEGRFTVIGNFPYNISTQILFKILDWRESVERVIGMFQKEVAQRIAAHEGSKTYGVISVLIQAFYKVEFLFEVSEQAFTPQPKVKSGVIRLTPLRDPLPARTEKMFFLLVKTAFNQRRKMLRNAVKGLFTEEVLQEAIFSRRAEQLTIGEFADLTWKMK